MKKLAMIVALLAAGPALADPVHGVWKTQVDGGNYAHITIRDCGGEICGVISRTFNAKGEWKSDNIGKPLVWGMNANGSNYKGGTIWQPSTGKKYRSKMTLSGDVLKVAGCVGPICKKQTWTRVK